MDDDTKQQRIALTAELNAVAGSREALEQQYGEVWDTQQLSAAFEVEGFLAPFAAVRRRADGVRGSVTFQHWPRYYFAFEPTSK